MNSRILKTLEFEQVKQKLFPYLTTAQGKEMLERLIPVADKLLIETDAPYLTPHPHRGERNEPFYTSFIASKMAELLELSVEEIEALTTQNTKNLFKEFSSFC